MDYYNYATAQEALFAAKWHIEKCGIWKHQQLFWRKIVEKLASQAELSEEELAEFPNAENL